MFYITHTCFTSFTRFISLIRFISLTRFISLIHVLYHLKNRMVRIHTYIYTNMHITIHMYSGITSGRVLDGELLYTKILEVNLFAFTYRLCTNIHIYVCPFDPLKCIWYFPYHLNMGLSVSPCRLMIPGLSKDI